MGVERSKNVKVQEGRREQTGRRRRSFPMASEESKMWRRVSGQIEKIRARDKSGAWEIARQKKKKKKEEEDGERDGNLGPEFVKRSFLS